MISFLLCHHGMTLSAVTSIKQIFTANNQRDVIVSQKYLQTRPLTAVFTNHIPKLLIVHTLLSISPELLTEYVFENPARYLYGILNIYTFRLLPLSTICMQYLYTLDLQLNAVITTASSNPLQVNYSLLLIITDYSFFLLPPKL